MHRSALNIKLINFLIHFLCIYHHHFYVWLPTVGYRWCTTSTPTNDHTDVKKQNWVDINQHHLFIRGLIQPESTRYYSIPLTGWVLFHWIKPLWGSHTPMSLTLSKTYPNFWRFTTSATSMSWQDLWSHHGVFNNAKASILEEPGLQSCHPWKNNSLWNGSNTQDYF